MPKTKLQSSGAKYDVRLYFSDKRNPSAKPSTKARQLQEAIEAINRDETVGLSACTTESCAQVVRGVKALAAQFDYKLSCRYKCIWTWSKLGGWQKECYFRCSDSQRGLSVEGTGR
jgi:hypothetical protein